MSAKRTVTPGGDGWVNTGDNLEDSLEQLSRQELIALARQQHARLSSMPAAADPPQHGRSEEALRLSRFAIDNAAEAMFTVSAEGRILDVNETTCRRLGYSAGELGRMMTFDFDAQFPKEGWADFWAELKEKGSMTIESAHRSKSGRLFPVEITTSHFEFEGAEYACSFVRDISERKQAEKRLRLTRFAVDRSQEAMFTVSAEGHILDVNDTACERLEYSREELLAMRTDEFDIHYRPEIWPDHFKKIKRLGSMRIESTHRSRSGRIFPVEIHEIYFQFEGEDYCCSFVIDTSERKRAEKALRLRRFAVDTATEAIFTTDTSGYVVDVNTAGCKRLEYSREELIGLPTSSFDLRFRMDKWPGYVEEIKRQGALVTESEHRTKSGRVFPVEVSIAYSEFEGEAYVCTFVRDITERKRVEKEQILFREALKEKNAALQAQNEELEAKNAEMERFTYTVSHDLKSPLVTIKGFIGLLERDATAGDLVRLRHDLERISAAADNMYRLLEELLELSRVGRVVHPPETVPLGALVDEVLELLASQLEMKAIEVVVEPQLPEVWCDRVRLLEVVQNLVENAIKFLGSQPAPRLEIGASQQPGETVCYLKDNGIGIDAKYQERVFGLFERLDPTIDGTGVGLTLVRRIIEVHHGRVWIESEGEGQGTTVFFSLPRASGAATLSP